jgi:hypothetical protein
MNASKYTDIDGKMVDKYRMAKLKEVEEKITADIKRHAKLLSKYKKHCKIIEMTCHFCRFVFKTGKNLPTAFLYGQLGHLPIYISRPFRILKSCLHILLYNPQQQAKIDVRINNLKFHIVIKEMIIYRPPAILKNNYYGVVNNRFCRFVLKIGKNVPTAFLYGELGHLPMYISRRFRILKYWLHILLKVQYFPS